MLGTDNALEATMGVSMKRFRLVWLATLTLTACATEPLVPEHAENAPPDAAANDAGGAVADAAETDVPVAPPTARVPGAAGAGAATGATSPF